MSLSIGNIIYTYPTPADFTGGEQPVSIESLKKWFDKFFSDTNGKFFSVRDNLLYNLNRIFGTSIELSWNNKYDHIKISNFVSRYADDCVEAVNAYKFYGNQIVNQINTLTDYIKQANELLAKWNHLNTNNLSDQAVSDLIHSDVVTLECLIKYSLEIEKEFSCRYFYDFDEDNWKQAEDNYEQAASNNFQIEDNYSNLEQLRSTNVKRDYGGILKDNPLECFNELNLLDRLKYIKVYYDITKNKTDYVFPNDKTFGLPCVRDEDKTKYIANIEKFYIGYLIDRDGPVNAFAGFFEMKVKAIEETVGLKQQELKAYNAYLDFINRGFDMLNSSQSDGKNRIPDGAIIAITYLCGQKMYKLFTDNSGKEFLVIPSVSNPNKFFLTPNNKYGMQFLLGDDGTIGEHRGNSSTNLGTPVDGLFPARYTTASADSVVWGNSISVGTKPKKYYTTSTKETKSTVKTCNEGTVVFYETEIGNISGTFTLPTELDITTIDPRSVYKYSSASTMDEWDKATKEHVGWEAVIESWTNAFQTKLTHLDTAIKTTQTDIQTLRDTINTYESLTKTLRSRTHDAGLNVVNKLVS